MKILHFALGFPPYRTGGLTKYCIDLMLAQKEEGHSVGLLWPGRIQTFKRSVWIRRSVDKTGIDSYEIVNPLPVPLDEGILDVTAYTAKCDAKVFEDYFKDIKPDVIHIHTLMGLYKELVDTARKLGIKTVFTTHDYFGLCPKVTLFRNGKTCNQIHDCADCVRCNQAALSLKKIQIMQSVMYRALKNTPLVKVLRRKHRGNFFDNKDLPEVQLSTAEFVQRVKNYERLREYYISIYSEIDAIHFNSTVAEMVYKKYFQPRYSQVINIAHRGIKDNRRVKDFKQEKLRITYLAPAKQFKGFKILKNALDDLWNEGERDFELNIFSLTKDVSAYMNVHDGYQYSELENIFYDTDLLVAPSVWYETFGFTVLEALSYGVPVLVSDFVGAKDIIPEGAGIIIENLDKEKLKSIISSIDCNKLKDMNRCILNSDLITWSGMCKNIFKLYMKLSHQISVE